MAYFDRIIERISQWTNWIGIGSLVAIMVLVVANIVTRFFGSVIPGTYSLASLIAVLTVSFAIVYTGLKRGHIVIELLVSRFSQRVRVILESFGLVLGIGIWALIAWAGLQHAGEMWLLGERAEPLRISAAPFRYVWGIAMVLFCLVLLINLFKVLPRAAKR